MGIYRESGFAGQPWYNFNGPSLPISRTPSLQISFLKPIPSGDVSSDLIKFLAVNASYIDNAEFYQILLDLTYASSSDPPSAQNSVILILCERGE